MTGAELYLSIYLSLISWMVGWALTMVALVFFHEEIFDFMDRLVLRVRKACGLPKGQL